MKKLAHGKIHSLVPLWLILFCCCQAPQSPAAHRGILDLTEWNFEIRGITSLNGEWHFFPGSLFSPEDLERNPKSAGYAEFPFFFTNHINRETEKHMKGTGHATFKLTIKLQEKDLIYALKIPDIISAYKLWVNNTLMTRSGRPGRSAQKTVPGRRLTTLFLSAKSGELSIVLQIANYHAPQGGLLFPILLGTSGQIAERDTFLQGGDLFVSGSLLIISLYHLVLFLLRKKDLAAHYFGLICLAFCIRTLFNGEMTIFRIFSHFGWEWESKIMYLADYILIALLPPFFKNLYPEDFSDKPVKVFQVSALLLILILLLTPIMFYAALEFFFQLLMVIMAVYVIWGLIKILRKKKKGGKLILTGFFLLFAAMINEILLFEGLIKSKSLMHPGLLIFIFSLAYVLSTRFSATFSTAEQNSIELNKKSRELIRKVRLKDEFLANTSHELLTPLNGIIGLSNSLLDGAGGKQSEFTRQNLKIIASDGKRLANQVNYIMDYLKLENKDLELNLHPVDIRLITKNVLNYQQDLARSQGIILINDITPDTPLVRGDETRLQQVLFNLINTALKFTNKGYIKINAIREKEQLKVEVEDSGIALPPEIMEPLNGNSSLKKGQNEDEKKLPELGLTISKNLIELHGGTLTGHSGCGKEARFTFTLPFDMEEHPPAREATKRDHAPETRENQTQYTVLAADDDLENLQVIVNILKLENKGYITASSGFEVLEILKKGTKVDLILLDTMMPRMTGYKTCKKIRTQMDRPKEDLPVILLTAKDEPRNLITGFDAGANDFITKPCDRQELKARINFHIGLAKKTIQLKELKEKLKKEIGEKKENIIRVNRRIEKHLDYARAVQISTLPKKNSQTDFFRDHFTLWLPKDPVGGDFYWFKNTGEKTALFAVADCTGHGIPGALMTMTAVSVLDSIADHSVKNDPAMILHKANILMRQTLHQHDKTTIADDGMDISLCYIDKKKKILIFAGAQNSLYKAEAGLVEEIKGDRRSIGYKNSREDFIYKNHTIPLTGHEQFYMISDGFIHQNGTASPFPMGKKKFTSFIKQCMDKPAIEQKTFLEKQLTQFMGDTEQRDDITVVGFKV